MDYNNPPAMPAHYGDSKYQQAAVHSNPAIQAHHISGGPPPYINDSLMQPQFVAQGIPAMAAHNMGHPHMVPYMAQIPSSHAGHQCVDLRVRQGPKECEYCQYIFSFIILIVFLVFFGIIFSKILKF